MKINSDIAKCINYDCTIKNSCLRFTGIGSERQVYSNIRQNKDGSCDHFISNSDQLPKPTDFTKLVKGKENE